MCLYKRVFHIYNTLILKGMYQYIFNISFTKERVFYKNQQRLIDSACTLATRTHTVTEMLLEENRNLATLTLGNQYSVTVLFGSSILYHQLLKSALVVCSSTLIHI